MAPPQLIGSVDTVLLLRARMRTCSRQRPLRLEAEVTKCNSRWPVLFVADYDGSFEYI